MLCQRQHKHVSRMRSCKERNCRHHRQTQDIFNSTSRARQIRSTDQVTWEAHLSCHLLQLRSVQLQRDKERSRRVILCRSVGTRLNPPRDRSCKLAEGRENTNHMMLDAMLECRVGLWGPGYRCGKAAWHELKAAIRSRISYI